MNNFEYWINHIADMPTKAEDGHWFDLETGLPYRADVDYQTGLARHRYAPSAQAKKGRELAKVFGGRALTGTAKQKDWAEKIRAEKLREMDMCQAELACDPKGLLTAAKFWIEARNSKGTEIGEFVQQQKALLKQYKSAKAEKDADQVKAIAEQYNALTEKWLPKEAPRYSRKR
ncbi:hypothetical protein [Halomonas piscis]|uniref:hypothetical protein n=1 Tax=Halomonas piscis TaxID=3031727 RepID=UPI00289ECF54|nr:hypothetical protein [Halomonas piscis]